MIVERRVELRFEAESREAETHTNLSAVRQDGRCLWVAGDETATIERLTAVLGEDGRVTGYAAQTTVALADLVPLPAGPGQEADIEGLARANGWLWAIGSHSLKRKKIKPGQSAAKARKRLATVVREDNRFILARLPLVTGEDGLPGVVREDGGRTAAVLGLDKDSLTDNKPVATMIMILQGRFLEGRVEDSLKDIGLSEDEIAAFAGTSMTQD